MFVYKLRIPFEELLTEARLAALRKIPDCVSDTVMLKMRTAYEVGFKGGVALIRDAKDQSHNY